MTLRGGARQYDDVDEIIMAEKTNKATAKVLQLLKSAFPCRAGLPAAALATGLLCSKCDVLTM